MRGHVVVADAAGHCWRLAGDPGAATTAAQLCQAPPGAPLGAPRAPRPWCCRRRGRHRVRVPQGEPVHVEVVRGLLGRAGVTESLLSCGPQLPMDEPSAGRSSPPAAARPRVTNNCSGKHAGMLAVCVVRGWPTPGTRWQSIRCRRRYAASWPASAVSTSPPARWASMAVACPPSGCRCASWPACTRRPSPSRGSGAVRMPWPPTPTSLAAAAASTPRCSRRPARHLTAKGGAAAVWVAVRRPAGPALAIKLEAGDHAALSAVALGALERAGLAHPCRGAGTPRWQVPEPTLRNWAGDDVGAIAVETGWPAPWRVIPSPAGVTLEPAAPRCYSGRQC